MILALVLSLFLQDDPAALVAKLGSADIAERAAAERKLTELGEKAEPALKAAAESPDPEIAARAKAILERIQSDRDRKALVKKMKSIPRFLGERTYTCSQKGAVLATLTLKTELKDEGVVLHDKFVPAEGARFGAEDLVQECRIDKFLTVRTIASTSDGRSRRGEVKGGKLVGPNETVDFPGDVIERHALYRVVSLLPAEEGFNIAFSMMEAEDFRVRPGMNLRCVGNADGVWRWEVKGREKATFWVKDGLLVKAAHDGLEIILVEK